MLDPIVRIECDPLDDSNQFTTKGRRTAAAASCAATLNGAGNRRTSPTNDAGIAEWNWEWPVARADEPEESWRTPANAAAAAPGPSNNRKRRLAAAQTAATDRVLAGKLMAAEAAVMAAAEAAEAAEETPLAPATGFWAWLAITVPPEGPRRNRQLVRRRRRPLLPCRAPMIPLRQQSD